MIWFSFSSNFITIHLAESHAQTHTLTRTVSVSIVWRRHRRRLRRDTHEEEEVNEKKPNRTEGKFELVSDERRLCRNSHVVDCVVLLYIFHWNLTRCRILNRRPFIRQTKPRTTESVLISLSFAPSRFSPFLYVRHGMHYKSDTKHLVFPLFSLSLSHFISVIAHTSHRIPKSEQPTGGGRKKVPKTTNKKWTEEINQRHRIYLCDCIHFECDAAAAVVIALHCTRARLCVCAYSWNDATD